MPRLTWSQLPERDTVQLTIYNSADLTLVRESRMLTLKEGLNQLRFSWENTLIDPTSLEMIPKTKAGEVDILGLTFPPRANNLGIFKIDSRISGKAPVEITYLTSGLDWRAFYIGTLSTDETSMRLEGYVRVSNNSGEDYDNAQIRLIVGQIHLLDEIAMLARRQYPYGQPDPEALLQDDVGEGGRAKRIFEKAAPEIMMPLQLWSQKKLPERAFLNIFSTPSKEQNQLRTDGQRDFPVSMFPKFRLKTFINLKRSALANLHEPFSDV
jgi:hypothetical protein